MSFIGEFKDFGGDFAPACWMKCEGQTLQISDYPDLFGVIKNRYGGDGVNTFNLPDARGRCRIGSGDFVDHNNATTPYVVGQKIGKKSVKLNVDQMPKHNHKVNAVSLVGDSVKPSGNLIADHSGLDKDLSTGTPDVKMDDQMITEVGGDQAHENMQPSLVATVIICVCGEIPRRKKNC